MASVFKRTLQTLAVLIGMHGLSQAALAETSVWQVSNGDSVLYLGGTVHLLRPSDYPLPEEFEQAYQASDEIVFEVDLATMNDLSTQAQMLAQLTYNDSRTLQSVLNEEAYAEL